MADGDVSVKVAIRVRKQMPRELIDCCRICTHFVPGEPQIIMGSDKAFTYDHVFDPDKGQREIYKTIIEGLVDSCFEGLNSTILAYGQTGAGKTYTMGTEFDEFIVDEQRGLIPRAVDHLFNKIFELKQEAVATGTLPPEFKVSAQFMELYNEEILDLLSPTGESKAKKSNLRIHEDANGEIYVDGMSNQDVYSTEEVLNCLKQGALCRTTASTNMNSKSSRSHALFSLKMHQMRAVKTTKNQEEGEEKCLPEFENLTAKLVFVDLAGSERLKRTGATGDRAKEGISINSGLLALGNVISALGDEKRKASHVPYRDSKLTRLLQDSLGGNSQTLMIACVSPSDRDFMETLNTLKYANRAKDIKNKVVVNQDKTSRMINMLREENMKLQQELMEYKMGQKTGSEGNFSDLFTENAMLRSDNDKLRLRLKSLKEAQDSKDETIAELRAANICSKMLDSGETDMTEMVQGYMKEIESLRSQLLEQEAAMSHRSPSRAPRSLAPTRLSMNTSGGTLMMNDSIDEVIREAKCDLEKTMAKRSKLEHKKGLEQTKIGENKENMIDEEGEDDEEDDDEEEMECENNFINVDDEMQVIHEGKEDDENLPEIKEMDEHEEEEQKVRDSHIQIMEEDLADLADEISMKQKLVEELEKSQKKITAMKMQYEEKLGLLQNQIHVTADERDKVLKTLQSKGDSSKTKEEIKSKSEHYSKKLKDMESEMKRLKSAQREHDKLLKQNKDNAKTLKALQTDITGMKKNKVKLMRQLKEETAKSKKLEMKKQQEIIKLQREKQKQTGQIKKLQMEKKSKDLVLKRKQEEIKMMKKQKNNTLMKRNANVRKGAGVMRHQNNYDQETPEERHSRRLSSQYSSFSARQKWNQIEKRISLNIIRKHTVAQMEAEMDRLVKDRERLEKELDNFIKKKDKALKEKEPNTYELQELDENIEGLSMQVEYLQENIHEHQSDIVEMMEGREGEDTIELQDIIDSSSLTDSKYLLEHFLAFTTNKGLIAAQNNSRIKELEGAQASLKKALEVSEAKHLEHFNNVKIMEPKEDEESNQEMIAEDSHFPNTGTLNSTKVNFSLLAGTPNRKFFPAPLSASPPVCESRLAAAFNSEKNTMNRRRTGTPSEFQGTASPLLSSSSTPSLHEPGIRTSGDGSASNSPVLERRGSIRRMNGGSLGATSDNVFDRLHSQPDEPPEGQIVPVEEKAPHQRLQCVSMVKGHAHCVQSVSVCGKIMVTGSSDRSIRVWDLQDNKEVQRASFPDDQVKKVVYSNEESVVYALTNQCLKAWDIRTDPKTCRTTSLTEFPSALLYPAGSRFIYFSTGISVRSWNVAQWTSAGVLHGHSGHVMCLEHVCVKDKKYIVTGSRDHFCKIYDATDGIVSSRVPTATLNPPHFDGIECIVWANENLYSGSRDATIKKWHLKTRREIGAMRPAHKDRVQALAFIENFSLLASASRNGTLKLWNEETFGAPKSDQGKSLIGEINAHPGSSIQDVKYNDGRLYTASGDTTVKIWTIK